MPRAADSSHTHMSFLLEHLQYAQAVFVACGF